MACLDTTLLIDLLGRSGARGRRAAQRVIAALAAANEPLTTTRLNAAELWVGVFRSEQPEADAALVERLMADLTILELDEAAARIFGRLTADAQRRGLPIGDMDALIGAVAIANNERIITRNVRHYSRIAGLEVQSY